MIFRQSPQARARYPERPVVPASTAAGLSGLEIIADTGEKDGYDFAYQPVRLVRHRLTCGDYGVVHDGQLVAAVERYGQLFGREHLREARIADRLARLQVRYQSVPTIFLGTRGLAQEWTYRFLGAARQWAVDEPAAAARIDSQSRGRAFRSAPSRIVGFGIECAHGRIQSACLSQKTVLSARDLGRLRRTHLHA